MGHLIPAGTGFECHRNIDIVKHVFDDEKKEKAEAVKEEPKEEAKKEETKKETKKEAKKKGKK